MGYSRNHLIFFMVYSSALLICLLNVFFNSKFHMSNTLSYRSFYLPIANQKNVHNTFAGSRPANNEVINPPKDYQILRNDVTWMLFDYQITAVCSSSKMYADLLFQTSYLTRTCKLGSTSLLLHSQKYFYRESWNYSMLISKPFILCIGSYFSSIWFIIDRV